MEAVDVVRQYYAAYNEKNWAGMLDLVHDDIVHYANQGAVRTGKAAFRDYLERTALQYDEWLANLVVFTSDVPSRLAVEFMANGTYKQGAPGLPEAHGQKYVLPTGAFIEMRDGKIYRLTTYFNLKDAIDQVTTFK